MGGRNCHLARRQWRRITSARSTESALKSSEIDQTDEAHLTAHYGGPGYIWRGRFPAYRVLNMPSEFIADSKSFSRVSPLFLVALAALIFTTSWLCVALTGYTGRVAAIWIPNAILTASLLKHARRDWTLMIGVAFVANVCANMVCHDGIVTGSGLAFANVIEALIIVTPLRWLGFDRAFSRTEVLLSFYALVLGAAVPMSALIAGVTLHYTIGMTALVAARSWYGADALGLCLLVPFFACVKLSALRGLYARDKVFGSAMLLSCVLGIAIASILLPKYSASFLFFPVLILLTFQRGFAGGAIGLAIAATASFTMVFVHHVSPYVAPYSMAEQVSIVQFYYAVIGFTIIMAGAALDDRLKLERWLATVVKRAEASREEAVLAKEVAERASSAKSTFLANMSHELRTPLNAVLGFSEIIKDEYFGIVGDARYREYAGLIHGAGSHLLDLITDILDMSKIEAGKLELHREHVSTVEVVRDCTELLEERAASAGITLQVNVASAPRAIDADRRALKQILLNLLSNAIKFTPSGGTVTVSARGSGGFCAFSVADTGIGIAATDLQRLGNPFVQLGNNDGSKPGTGLGLALVRALTEMHGGELKIESTEGRGTTATVTIPMAVRHAVAA
jgi:signal transduction histidine kinase